MTTLDLDDIQGLVARGYGALRAARYALLSIDDGDAARRWLDGIVTRVTPASARSTDSALQVAVTSSGLAKLGLPGDTLAGFADEFVSGMTTPHRRRILADVEESAPERWDWGGPTTTGVDLLLLVFARDAAALASVYAPLAAAWTGGGLTAVKELDTSDLGDKEHFGFRDGVSQPTVEGLSSRGDRPANTVKAGEFILGYPNEYGLYTDRPLLPASADPSGLLPRDAGGSGAVDLGRNGGYLVFRQLRQDVRGFRRFLATAARDGGGTDGPPAAARLAARMVGRWPSGAPLVLAPDGEQAALADANDFGYAAIDPYGYRCPIGAHIRRAHPRDALDPHPGSDASIALDKRHRLLRRGREYGPPLPPDETLAAAPASTSDDRGLHFICVNANIARQFEFVHHTWLNNPKFAGLYDDADPLIGAHRPSGGTFTMQAPPVRTCVTGLPRFVQPRGGAYFFLPGLRTLRYLARLGG